MAGQHSPMVHVKVGGVMRNSSWIRALPPTHSQWNRWGRPPDPDWRDSAGPQCPPAVPRRGLPYCLRRKLGMSRSSSSSPSVSKT